MTLFAIFLAKYLYVILIALALVFFFAISSPRDRRRFALFAVLLFPIALILSRIASALYFDPRPFVTGNFVPLIPHAADNGFPSDHALLSFALAVLVLRFQKWWGAGLFLMAIGVGAGRMLVGVHSWRDIVGSLGVVALAALITSVIYPFLLKRMSFEKNTL